MWLNKKNQIPLNIFFRNAVFEPDHFNKLEDEKVKFKQEYGWVICRNEEKLVIQKILSTIKQQQSYTGLVKKNLLSSKTTYVFSHYLSSQKLNVNKNQRLIGSRSDNNDEIEVVNTENEFLKKTEEVKPRYCF